MPKKNVPNVASFVTSILPDHVVQSYPELVEFARVFFDYLETENKSSYYQNNLYSQRDIREQEPEFLNYIQRELGILSKQEYAANPQVFYDKISEVWKSKGSEESIKTFFRLFLDDEVEIYYPWDSVLIPSDGRWNVETVLRITPLNGDPYAFAGKRIYEAGSNATAVVDSVKRKIYQDIIIYELTLLPETVSIVKFTDHKTIYVNSSLSAEIYRSGNGFVINNAGTGYNIGDKITVQGFQGSSVIAQVTSVNSLGGIVGYAISDFGSGNTPDSVISTNDLGQYYLIDFLLYQFLDYGLITETEIHPYINYGLITELAALADDDVLVDPKVIINIDSINGVGAELVLTYGALAKYQGYYKGVRGQLSESIVLQDSKYYQKFSYEVKTTHQSSSWMQPLKKFAHPAGMEVISNVFTFNFINTEVKNAFIFVGTKDPVEYIVLESPQLTDSITGFVQSYYVNSDMYYAEDYYADISFNLESTVSGQATQATLNAVEETQTI